MTLKVLNWWLLKLVQIVDSDTVAAVEEDDKWLALVQLVDIAVL